jgi:hypothetical protein
VEVVMVGALGGEVMEVARGEVAREDFWAEGRVVAATEAALAVVRGLEVVAESKVEAGLAAED